MRNADFLWFECPSCLFTTVQRKPEGVTYPRFDCPLCKTGHPGIVAMIGREATDGDKPEGDDARITVR